MNRFLALLLAFGLFSCQQEDESWKLPEPVTNQASVVLNRSGKPTAYTFYGLDSSKSQKGVHQKVLTVDLVSGIGRTLEILPDSLGRLASSASVINNQAYLAGGYAVFPDGSEKSSNQLFRFDPEVESLQLLSETPIPIDDHIQSVYQDRYLYLISGWSDSTNVNAVQIFDTQRNVWSQGTPLPDELEAKTFGGVGIIVQDTIYVLGGATFTPNYPPGKGFYKGVISRNDPNQISWSKENSYPGNFRYRSGVFHHGGIIYFVGGSNETYNYNGISYAEKSPVNPNSTTLTYEISTGRFDEIPDLAMTMDLRNLAEDSEGKVYVIGGMEENQRVSDQVRVIFQK